MIYGAGSMAEALHRFTGFRVWGLGARAYKVKGAGKCIWYEGLLFNQSVGLYHTRVIDIVSELQ